MSRYHHIDLQNPLRGDHPLNVARVGWWYIPPDSGWAPPVTSGAVATGTILRDLCKQNDGIITIGGSNIPQLGVLPTGDLCLQWGSGGSIDGQVNLGGATKYDFTDNFTVGCTFITDTLAPAGTGSLAGLLNKYNSPGGNEWTFRQHNATLEFGGSTLVASGSILATNTLYRAIAVCRAGTAYIYLNGVIVASGAVSISSGSDVVYIGEAYEPVGANFRGRINDAFIAARPWSDGDVQMDLACSLRQYRVENSPLRFLDSRQYFRSDGSVGVQTFSDAATATDLFQIAGPVSFSSVGTASASASGFGNNVPDGPSIFSSNAVATGSFQGDVPTLVNFTSSASATDSLSIVTPVSFSSVAFASQSLSTIANGNRKIIAMNRYKR